MKTIPELKNWIEKDLTEYKRKTKFLQENIIQLDKRQENKLRRDIARLENEIIDIRNGINYLITLEEQKKDPLKTLIDQKQDLESLIFKIEKTIDGAVMTTKEKLLNKQRQTGKLKGQLNIINFLLQ